MDLSVSSLTRYVCCSDDYENRLSRTRSRSRSSNERSPTPRRRRLLSSSSDTEYTHQNIPYSDDAQTMEKGGPDLEETPHPPVATLEVVPVAAIPAHIEGLLGQEGAPPTNNSIELHETLTKRWTAILQNGLEAETKANILSKHNAPKNCSLLVPPLLNEGGSSCDE